MRCLNFFQQVVSKTLIQINTEAIEYPKQLYEFHNNYPLLPGKIEIKREMLSKYQLKISDVYKYPYRYC